MAYEHLAKGLMQVYTGDGKGKTTCALGLALRAAGQGFKVYFVQFLKGRETGESLAVARLAPEVALQYFGRPGLVNLRNPASEDLAAVQEAWASARQALAAGEYDLVVLDEFNLVLDHGLVPMAEALEALCRRPPWVEVVLTARRAPAEVVEMADLVTEMRPIKHYYQAGVKARRGIEW